MPIGLVAVLLHRLQLNILLLLVVLVVVQVLVAVAALADIAHQQVLYLRLLHLR
jgi:hypothetical protein